MSTFLGKSNKVWDKAWTDDNWGGSALSLLSGAASILGAGHSNAQTGDTSRYYNELNRFGSMPYNTDSFDILTQDYETNNFKMPELSDISKSPGERLQTTASSAFSGATAGASVAGPLGAVIGGAIGLGSGLLGWAIGGARERRELDRINDEYKEKKLNNIARFNYSADLINDKTFNGAALNYMALGGDLYDNAMIKKHYNNGKVKTNKRSYVGNLFAYGGNLDLAGDWSNGVTIIGEGGSHEMNPYNGVQLGIDSNGVPNLVEEGEVIFNDYVYSNRLKPTEKQLDEVKLDLSFADKPFSDIAKEIAKESSERPNDPISKNGLIDGMMKLQAIQEDIRSRKQIATIKRQINKIAKENPEVINQVMTQQPQAEQTTEEQEPFDFNARYAPNGNPAEELEASYPEEMANGGNLFAKAGYLDYDNTKGFKYYNNGKYTQAYLDWLNNYDIEKSPYWSDLQSLYKSRIGRDLTVKEARRLGQDEKFGRFHNIFGDAFTEYLTSPDNTNNNIRNVDKINPVTPPTIPGIATSDTIKTITNPKNSITQTAITERPRTQYPNPTDNIYDSNNSILDNLLRLSPVIGSVGTVLGDLFGLNRYDYRNSDMIGDAASRIRSVRAPQLYNYLRYTPYDTNYNRNRLQNLQLGTQRNILNTTSGNRAAALSALLTAYNNGTSQMGDMYRQALEYNDTQRKNVSEFNRDTDTTNLNTIMNASQLNQNADYKRADLAAQEALFRDRIDTAVSAARSNNLNNLFSNLQGLYKDDLFNDWAEYYNKHVAHAPEYRTRKCGGKIKKHKRLI